MCLVEWVKGEREANGGERRRRIRRVTDDRDDDGLSKVVAAETSGSREENQRPLFLSLSLCLCVCVYEKLGWTSERAALLCVPDPRRPIYECRAVVLVLRISLMKHAM